MAGTLQTLTLRSTGIESPLLRLNPPTAKDCPTLFTVMKKDLDGDGVADPFSDPQVAALGGLDMWPLVVLSYLRDLDGNPVEDQVTTQVLVSPSGLPDGLAVNTPYATDTLPLMFLPVAQRTNARRQRRPSQWRCLPSRRVRHGGHQPHRPGLDHSQQLD